MVQPQSFLAMAQIRMSGQLHTSANCPQEKRIDASARLDTLEKGKSLAPDGN
jgi:hypothetical protein